MKFTDAETRRVVAARSYIVPATKVKNFDESTEYTIGCSYRNSKSYIQRFQQT